MKTEYSKAKRNCIVISLEEFEQILDQLAYSTDLSMDGLTYCNMKEDYVKEESIYPALEQFFEVKKITSIHADDYDYPGIWIVYEDE